MSNPIPSKHRSGIDALTGIKSSLGQIRSIVALLYLLYKVSNHASHIKYCKRGADNKLTIEDSLLKQIEEFLGENNLKDIIVNNPLFVKQYEPLYVGITLLYRLGKIVMPGKSNATIERTGGIRYPKEVFFAENIVYLDLILRGFNDDVIKQSLQQWLKNQIATNLEFESRVTSFLSLCTIHTQFKIRPEEGKELFFQTEGLYTAIKNGQTDLKISDIREFVGPTRIYNNVLKEGLDPWLALLSDGNLAFSDKTDPTPESVSEIISTTLDICCVKNDEVSQDSEDKQIELTYSINTAIPLQTIYYGCPGTGKSFKVKNMVEGKDGEDIVNFDENGDKIEDIKSVEDKSKVTTNIFRTTFHPDYDYSSFVGSYKPVMNPVLDEDGNPTGKEDLAYDFVPQVFTNAYVRAWKSLSDASLTDDKKQVFLIIEEINRGNCAQIFGDLFQLLDRKNGYSEYHIIPDAELRKYLEKQGLQSNQLQLPPNLHILATMNTSDQSLFPMDSAFKRRWAMEYVPINLEQEKAVTYTFEVKGKKYSWVEFLRKVNPLIRKATDSEDKQMGEFFIKGKISEDDFKNKVMFYIWNDVCKDLYSATRISQPYFMRSNDDLEGTKNVFTFAELYGKGHYDEDTQQYTEPSDLLEGFITKKLGLAPLPEKTQE